MALPTKLEVEPGRTAGEYLDQLISCLQGAENTSEEGMIAQRWASLALELNMSSDMVVDMISLAWKVVHSSRR